MHALPPSYCIQEIIIQIMETKETMEMSILFLIFFIRMTHCSNQCELCTQKQFEGCKKNGIEPFSMFPDVRHLSGGKATVQLSLNQTQGGACWFFLERINTPKIRLKAPGTIGGISQQPSGNWVVKRVSPTLVKLSLTSLTEAQMKDQLGPYELQFRNNISVNFYVYTSYREDVVATRIEAARVSVEESASFVTCRNQSVFPPTFQLYCDGQMLNVTESFDGFEENGSVILKLNPDSCRNFFTFECCLGPLPCVAPIAELDGRVPPLWVLNTTLPLPDLSGTVPEMRFTTFSYAKTIEITVPVVLLTAFLITLVLFLRKHKKKREDLAKNQPITHIGPRILIPELKAVESKLDVKDSGRSSVTSSNGTSVRPRLWSILSYFSSSSSSSNETDETDDIPLISLWSDKEWMKNMLFDLESFDIGAKLGEGEYGIVYKALVKDGNARWPVAIKASSEINQDNLIMEGEMMSKLPYHENIANLQGVALEEKEDMPVTRFYLMIEFCSNGSLRGYLKGKRRSFEANLMRCQLECPGVITNRDHNITLLIAWGYQIANGMEFLSQRGIIHGDLATRNVLLTEDLTAKISDFGLAHLLNLEEQEESMHLRNTKLPEYWVAPEVFMNRKVTKYSDCWSYGITLYEIFSLGETPYRDMIFESTKHFIDSLVKGSRLECPEFCPNEIYRVMTQCWAIEPSNRAEFHAISCDLKQFLDPEYDRRYQEAREEMLLRNQHVIQNRLYFNMNGVKSHPNCLPSSDMPSSALARYLRSYDEEFVANSVNTTETFVS